MQPTMPVRDESGAPLRSWPTRAALVIVFCWFALGGAAHFLFTEAQMRIVPP